MTASPTVEVESARFSHGAVAVLSGLAVVTRWPWLVVAVFVMVAVPTLGGGEVAPFSVLHRRLISPRRRPDRQEEYEPAVRQRFAHSLACVALGVATLALAAGWTVLAWSVCASVAVLAALAAGGACLGCRLHDRLLVR